MAESRMLFSGKRNETTMDPGPGAEPAKRAEWALVQAQEEAYRLTELRATEYRAAFHAWVEAYHAGSTDAPPKMPRAAAVEVKKSGRDIPDFAIVDSDLPACAEEEFDGAAVELLRGKKKAGHAEPADKQHEKGKR